MHKTIKEILQIAEISQFESECEKYRDVLLDEPNLITKDEVILILKISANFLMWQCMIDDAILKLVSLCGILEPVFGEIVIYDHYISVLCTNLCFSDISMLQYTSLSLLEAGYQNNTLNTNYYSELITQISGILKTSELENYIKEQLYCLER